jgi:dihydropteroate synthase
MGIINVTPNSLSDSTLKGNDKEIPIEDILAKVKSWVDGHCVDIVDIGGESTRPGHSSFSVFNFTLMFSLGSPPIEEGEELRRVLPVVERLRKEEWARDLILSVDTTKSSVAEAALKAGANIINDISAATRDRDMLSVRLFLNFSKTT